jgi:hypothetical protein
MRRLTLVQCCSDKVYRYSVKFVEVTGCEIFNIVRVSEELGADSAMLRYAEIQRMVN